MNRLAIFLLALFGFSCSQAQQKLTEACPLPEYDDRDDVECGYISVPENRKDPHTRQIKLAYLVLKARSGNPKSDPIVYLQGGPGGATLPMANYWENSPLRINRDFILIDQRGTGFSNAVCTDLGDKLLEVLSEDLTVEEEKEAMLKVAKGCKAELKKEGVDQAGYNTIANAQDLDDLRKALGHEKWNLFGGSYGSRLALAYMRDFPQHTRTSIMSGMFPPQVNLYEHFVSNFSRSLELTFAACAENESCSRRYPNFKEDYYAVFESLKKKPVTFSWGGEPFTLNAQDLLLFTHQMLYTRNTIGQVPAYIKAIQEKDDEVLAAAVQPLAGRARLINIAMNWSFNAHDEYTFSQQAEFQADLDRNARLKPGPAFFSSDPDVLEQWHPHRAPAYVNEPVKSAIPSLVANGNFDPITPPANAEATVKHLDKAYYTVFPTDGHSVFGTCYFGIVQDFLKDPDSQPDMSCAKRKRRIDWQ